ncbi:MAG: prepilin peptidase [Acidobacteriota bacterium]|jgi:Type II secretory pathway, prepilin signal peptidase PulO and related peptidases|nr:prepilin peptidase [Acidobacteriota bacterium]OQB54503.1 MAG: Type 4 prepilin-like proteins leader peptide-processing enzyme [Candidatus Aminicenantes bacterium ADurb.Bin147]HOS12230.1 prepilin peptidase [Candidatus Aminicenantes bacterium]MDD8009782.1 prepilin peptidase [Acidobacteriota bacterium]MDD8027965.1 prepilin peptidase [Acidobacteriota bacterium]
MEALILVVVFGLAWGSFLNVVIHRVPRRMSLLRPPSSCPSCGARIKPYENIPVLSYLILRGKCRRCRAPISLRYPAVELLTPVLLAVLYVRAGGFTLSFFASALFTSGLIALAFIDARHQILPDALTFPGIVLGFAYAFFRDDLTPGGALLGAAAGGGFLLLVYGFYRLIRKREGLGFGDVTFMLMIGAFLGWEKTLLTLILASFAGAIFGLLLMKLQGRDMKFALPFGSFLAPAAYVALVWGDRIIAAYLARFPQ